MTHKFLIDECLSPKLAEQAREAGHFESTHVVHRGWEGLKDYELIREIVAGDFVLVTHNAKDFRGGGLHDPGGYHAEQEIHAGLVCLISAKSPWDRARQMELFAFALDYIGAREDLINVCVEVFEDEGGEIRVQEYALPTWPAPAADQ